MLVDNEFKIPKKEIQVKIKLCGKHKEGEYIVFLNQFSRIKKGEEDIEEFLENTKGFIPVKEIKKRVVELININNILYLIESKVGDEAIFDKNPFEIYLKDGIKFNLNHFIVLPNFRSRILDYLNTDLIFLKFGYKGDIIFINKKKIIKINQ